MLDRNMKAGDTSRLFRILENEKRKNSANSRSWNRESYFKLGGRFVNKLGGNKRNQSIHPLEKTFATRFHQFKADKEIGKKRKVHSSV